MTDQEINEAVARKLGKDVRNGYIYLQEEPDDVREEALDIPAYSTDISAAWEIVEWCKEKMKGSFHWDFTLKRSDRTWSCEMFGYDPEEADTAPKAICLAFLKLP